MVKDTVQSLKLENDKLKDKIQEICAELRNLRDEVKAERNGGHASSSEGTDEGNTTATPNSIQEDLNRIVPADIGLRESSSLEHAAIYDHLSPRLQSLLSDAKKIKERFLFSFCWAKNSTIWLRKNETSRPIAIKNSTDLSSVTARLGSSGVVTTP